MSSIGEATLRSLAAAIATNGMLAADYSWFNLDDGIVSGRDAAGALVADAAGFPSGVRALADYVNALGLALGAYTDRGTSTCEVRIEKLRTPSRCARWTDMALAGAVVSKPTAKNTISFVGFSLATVTASSGE